MSNNQPKPFVFVLMPFAEAFDDIYQLGIKAAVTEAGAYAERLDEQIFTEGMLDRIFNQISKADVVVADMTGRNPNVFYEVGYAHALGKTVLLVTESSDDIPFDLKHQQHLVYDGKISKLKDMLKQKIVWAIDHAADLSKSNTAPLLSLRVFEVEIPDYEENKVPHLDGHVPRDDRYFSLPIYLRNESPKPVSPISHVYLYMATDSELVPAGYNTTESFTVGDDKSKKTTINPYPLQSFDALPFDCTDDLNKQVRLPLSYKTMPPGAIEDRVIGFMFKDELSESATCKFKVRFHTQENIYDYIFELGIDRRDA